MTKLLSILVITVKENNNHVIDLLKLIYRNFWRYIFYSYYIDKNKYSKYCTSQLIIHALVSLCLLSAAEDKKTKCMMNPFLS